MQTIPGFVGLVLARFSAPTEPPVVMSRLQIWCNLDTISQVYSSTSGYLLRLDTFRDDIEPPHKIPTIPHDLLDLPVVPCNCAGCQRAIREPEKPPASMSRHQVRYSLDKPNSLNHNRRCHSYTWCWNITLQPVIGITGARLDGATANMGPRLGGTTAMWGLGSA